LISGLLIDSFIRSGTLTVAEVFMLTGALNNAREVAQKIATQHRDLHGAVSKVGKAIDRVSHFIDQYTY
jgi:hypothetical protein